MIERFNYNFRSIKCPQCMLISFTAVYASCIFKNKEKELLFRDHIKCLFGGDPTITRHLDNLNTEWLALVETTASSEGHGIFGAALYAEGYSKTLDAEVLHVSSNHAKFRLRDGSIRVVVFCLMPDCLCLRIVLGSDPLFRFEHEDEYADEAVGYFNRQLGASWEAIPYIFRDGAETCIMSRRFGETYCAMKFRLLKFCPFKRLWKDVPEGMPAPMKDQLANIRLQNFKFTWRDIERMIEGKFNFVEEVENEAFPFLHDLPLRETKTS